MPALLGLLLGRSPRRSGGLGAWTLETEIRLKLVLVVMVTTATGKHWKQMVAFLCMSEEVFSFKRKSVSVCVFMCKNEGVCFEYGGRMKRILFFLLIAVLALRFGRIRGAGHHLDFWSAATWPRSRHQAPTAPEEAEMEGGSWDCCVLCLLSLSDVSAKRHTDCSQENTAANQNTYRRTTSVCEVNKLLYREPKGNQRQKLNSKSYWHLW